MTPLLKNLLGNGGAKDRETAEEMRALLDQMRQERARCETLVGSVTTATDRLHEIGDPIAQAVKDVDAITGRLVELEQRFSGMLELSRRLVTIDERTEELSAGQQRAEQQIVDALENAKKLNIVFEDLGRKVEIATVLREGLTSFLDVDKPFTQLRGEADGLRTQIENTSGQLARLREQHDRLLDAHKLATTKMEALDRRRDDLGRELQDKERRVANVEQAVRGMDGVSDTVADVKRDMGTLKALGDTVLQKTAALETQREAVDRALTQAEHLDRAMRQVEAGTKQLHENEKTFSTLQDHVTSLRVLHETVVERSGEITKLQRETDDQTRTARQELTAARDEMKRTIERFDFESRGLESVTQRVADLRGALSDFENRFKTLGESSQVALELKTQTTALSGQLQVLGDQAADVDREMTKLLGIRRDIDDVLRTSRDAGTRIARIEETRPAVEAALRNLEQLGVAHASVKEALEQTRIAHDEITRVRAGQSEAKTWMSSVEQSVSELGGKVAEVLKIEPVVQVLHGHSLKLNESIRLVESRGEFVEDLHRRLAELGAVAAKLDDRSSQLQLRTEAAEQRLVGLGEQSEEAAKLSNTLSGVTSRVEDAQRKTDEVRNKISSIVSRCESVEELAEKTRALKPELEQREQAVESAARDLERAGTLRQEAAASAQELGELAMRLATAVTSADERTSEVTELASKLEDRASGLRTVDKRLGQFEERMAKWSTVEQELNRAIEQMAARQGTVEAVQADLDRMLVMAETTASTVREITATHDEIEERRGVLQDVLGQLKSVKDTASALEERNRQITRAEERLARAEALQVDVRSGLEALQGQKALVDQAVEKAGSLQFLLRQAEAMIDGLREERSMSARVRNAVTNGREDGESDDEAKAA